jgi:hypothetical protein
MLLFVYDEFYDQVVARTANRQQASIFVLFGLRTVSRKRPHTEFGVESKRRHRPKSRNR